MPITRALNGLVGVIGDLYRWGNQHHVLLGLAAALAFIGMTVAAVIWAVSVFISAIPFLGIAAILAWVVYTITKAVGR